MMSICLRSRLVGINPMAADLATDPVLARRGQKGPQAPRPRSLSPRASAKGIAVSGIAGIIHFDGKPVEPGLIQKMTSVMAHRGRDGINHWVKGSVALGQCMPRTTPESLEEHQPLTNEDESLVLVMDGRVDNWEELRKELLSRGVRLGSGTDAELVLRAYEIWLDATPYHIYGEHYRFVPGPRARNRWTFFLIPPAVELGHSTTGEQDGGYRTERVAVLRAARYRRTTRRDAPVVHAISPPQPHRVSGHGL